MFSSDELFAALNVSDITELLDDYQTKTTEIKALFDALLVPEDFEGTEYINFYLTSPVNGALEYGRYRYTINCRSKDYDDSLNMAWAVLNEINRKSYTDYYIVCDVLQTIPPADNTDVFNTPIEAVILKR